MIPASPCGIYIPVLAPTSQYWYPYPGPVPASRNSSVHPAPHGSTDIHSLVWDLDPGMIPASQYRICALEWEPVFHFQYCIPIQAHGFQYPHPGTWFCSCTLLEESISWYSTCIPEWTPASHNGYQHPRMDTTLPEWIPACQHQVPAESGTGDCKHSLHPAPAPTSQHSAGTSPLAQGPQSLHCCALPQHSVHGTAWHWP